MKIQISTLSDYHYAALRTAKTHSPQVDFSHAVLGLVTEVAEIIHAKDAVNLHEEIGDAAWYLPLLCRSLNTTLLEFADSPQMTISYFQIICEAKNRVDAKMSLIEITGHLADLEKKRVAYDRPINRALALQLAREVFILLARLCSENDVSLLQCLCSNIHMLYVRYPEKFTNECALERNLDAERRVLAGAGCGSSAEALVTPPAEDDRAARFTARVMKHAQAEEYGDWMSRTPGEIAERVNTETQELERLVYSSAQDDSAARACVEQAAAVGAAAMMVGEWYSNVLRCPRNPQTEVTT